jgi:uncharacterized membrane protein YkvI
MPAWAKAAFVYIGTVIGAGFASGQEIYVFFSRYGTNSLKGMAISTFLFCIIGGWVLFAAYTTETYNIYNLLTKNGSKTEHNVFELFSSLVLLSNFFIMSAGSGTLLEANLHVPYPVGVFAMLSVSGFVVFFGLKGLSEANTLTVPVILAAVLFIGAAVPGGGGINHISQEHFRGQGWWFVSALNYVCLNMVSASHVLAGTAKMMRSSLEAVVGGVAGGLGLGLSLFVINHAVMSLGPAAGVVEMPMLEAAVMWTDLDAVYGVNLWLAMFTTAVSCGFALVQKATENLKMTMHSAVFLLSALTLPLAMFGFASLVKILYPLFGMLTLAVVICLVFKRILHLVRELHII